MHLIKCNNINFVLFVLVFKKMENSVCRYIEVTLYHNKPTGDCPPPYFAEGEKNFGFITCKRPLLRVNRKKGKILVANCPPLFSRKMIGPGQLGGFAVMWITKKNLSVANLVFIFFLPLYLLTGKFKETL